MVEMMVVLAVIAILCLIALPNVQDKLVRDQIVEASRLADIAKTPIAAAWAATKTLPSDNASAGLPVADKIVNNFVSAVTVEAGAIHMTFGNRANARIQSKVLSFRPAVVDDAPMVPVTWVCGHAAPPNKMTAKGDDKTNVPDNFLPLNCRSK